MTMDYVDLLSEELVRRKRRNDRYSERAFARAIGISAGFLKHILQRKKNLGPQKALEVARRLNWTDYKTEQFLQLIKKKKAASQTLSSEALLAPETFAEISDWYYFPLVELFDIKTDLTAAEIAKRLGLSKPEAEYALRKLENAGLIKSTKDGYRKAEGEYEIPSMSHGAIRRFHRQTLLRAAEAVDAQAYDQRELRALTLSFDTARLPEAEAEITKFLKSFERKFGKGKKNSVYQMNIAMVRADRS